MSQTMLSVRVDLDDKKAFESFCDNMGINVSTAINMYIKAVLRENRIPFEIGNNNTKKKKRNTSKKSDESILSLLDELKASLK